MTAPIRVAYISLSPTAGGAERQMLSLAERLPRDRFAPELIVGDSATAAVQVERARRAGIAVRSLEPERQPSDAAARTGGPVRALAGRAAKAARLVRLVRAIRPDVIDAWLYPADVALALVAPLAHSPMVLSGRRNIDPHDRFGPAEPLVERLVSRLTDTVVANCQAAADHAIATQHVRPGQVRIIRNGVLLPDPIAPEERRTRRRALGAEDDTVIVASVASYTPAKRLDRLVAAFARIARDQPAARLELIGDGPGRPALEAQVRELGLERRVCLHGYVPEPESLVPAFDIVALSSEREGLPNALLEAGAAGVPVVSTAAGGAGEIVLDGETGLLVPVADEAALTAALGRLVGNEALRARLGAAGRERVGSAFGMDRFVAEFGALYEERVGARRRRADRTGAP